VRLDPKRWKTTPYGATEEPINPMAMAIAMDCSFVARGFSYKPNQLADILVEAMHHRGFALVDVLSPCPTFNQDQNEEFYRSHTFDVPPEHDPTDRLAAFSLALESDRFAIGILYKNPAKPNIVDEQDYLRKRWRHPEGQDDHLSLLDELIHRFA